MLKDWWRVGIGSMGKIKQAVEANVRLLFTLRCDFSDSKKSVSHQTCYSFRCSRRQFVTSNHDPHKKHIFSLYASLLVKWAKNGIILGTMQIGTANDHCDYASLKFS